MSPAFLEAKSRTPLPGCPALLGVPYDGTASFRRGTGTAPHELRQASENAIESYSPRLQRDLADLAFADLGDLDLPPKSSPETIFALVRDATASLLAARATPVLIGGEHSISPGAIHATLAQFPDLHVLQLDAHADLRESYQGSTHSHACAMRRVLDALPSDRLLQAGIRSGTKEEYAELHQTNRLLPATAQALAERLPPHGTPLWLTFDVDILDPADCPGTGTPEAGGLTYRELEPVLDLLLPHHLVGLDLVELAPALDPNGPTLALGTKLLRELLLTLAPH